MGSVEIAATLAVLVAAVALLWLSVARRRAQVAMRRAAFLADAGAVMSAALHDEALLQRVAELAVPRMADWCAIFLRDDTGVIRCVAFHHAEPAKAERGRAYIAAQPIAPDAPYGVAHVMRTGMPDVANRITEEMLRAVSRDEAGVRMRRELGHRATMIVPLRSADGIVGAISFGRAVADAYRPADVMLGEDLAHRVSLAVANVALYRQAHDARRRAERAQWQAALLAEASRILASSLDYDVTLDTLLRLVVPTLSDWAIIHVALRDGTLRRLGPAYADPRLAALAEELRRGVPVFDLDSASATIDVLRSGQPFLVQEVTAHFVEATIKDERYRDFVLRLNPQSVIIVPLVARNRTLGAMTLVSLDAARRYDSADLHLAEDLARRSATAVDNARLYRQTEVAKREAEAANRAKDEFLAVLSHELRTPLNAISGWLKLLETGTLTAGHAERALATVNRNVGVLRRLIEDLLDVSGIIAGKLFVDRVPCDVTALVEQTLESFEGEAGARGVRLTTSLDRAMIVEGDPVRLRQIVGNLLSNALKFTGPGGEVKVGLARQGRRGVLTVTDTGAGIAPTLLPHVFERFRQGDSSSTRLHGGLGLGLAIVKHLVELHQGTVRAESPGPGAGATFTVELPLAD